MFNSNLLHFSSSISKVVVGSITNKLRSGTIGGTDLAKCLNSLENFLPDLLLSINRMDADVQLMTCCLADISLPERSLITPEDYQELKFELSSDMASAIQDAIPFIKEHFGSHQMTLMNGAISIVPITDGRVLTDGVIPLLASSETPVDVTDCIVFNDNGVVMCNPVIKSFDFHAKTSDEDVPTGHVFYLMDVLQAAVESNSLNAAIYDTASAIVGGQEGFKTFISSGIKMASSKLQVVKDFFSRLTDSYVQGGFKGAVMFVLSYFKTAASITDDDGLLVFTDNNSFVPAQYIVGTIGMICSTLGLIASTVASFFQPILGAIGSVLFSGIYGVVQSIQYDSDATNVGLNPSDLSCLGCAPFALYHGDVTVSDADLLNYIQSNPVGYINVPGGIVLYGPAAYDNSGMLYSIRYEFHPSIDNNLSVAKHISSAYTYNDETNGSNAYYVGPQSGIRASSGDLIATDIESRLASAHSSDTNDFQNGRNNRLSDSDDTKMSAIITGNVFLFTMWLIGKTLGASGVSYTPPAYIFGCSITYNPSTGAAERHAVITGQSSAYWPNYIRNNNVYDLCSVALITSFSTPFPNESFFNYGGFARLSWANQVKFLYSYMAALEDSMNSIINSKSYYGLPVPIIASPEWAIIPAKYDSDTFLYWIILSVVVTTVVAAVAVVGALKLKAAILSKRASNNAKVEAAWEDLKTGKISWKQYKKTVKKANLWQKIIGGTRYDYENYWNGDVSDNDSSSTSLPDNSSISSTLSQLNDPSQSIDELSPNGISNLEELYLLIRGSLNPSEN